MWLPAFFAEKKYGFAEAADYFAHAGAMKQSGPNPGFCFTEGQATK